MVGEEGEGEFSFLGELGVVVLMGCCVRGVNHVGGVVCGGMDVGGLEGYGAAFSIQEMFTVKMDDVEGRTKIYESMVKGKNSLEAGTTLSFDVLCNEIRGLGLNIVMEKKRLGRTGL